MSDTVILQKPGKTHYTVAKAWRPIALLGRMSRILSRCVTDVLVFEAEPLFLIASHQFGGGAGRTTTDSIHLIAKTVKDAWRKGHAASVVFLDIKSVFPAASTHGLCHNLRMQGVPRKYMDSGPMGAHPSDAPAPPVGPSAPHQYQEGTAEGHRRRQEMDPARGV